MKIIVLGAYGYTGQLICEELIHAKIDFVGVGRDEVRLSNLSKQLTKPLKYEQFDMLDPKQVANILTRFDVFINCIGPFAETAMHLLEQLVKMEHKYYLDLTGESFFVQNSYDMFHHLTQKNKTTILHSCAFESVLTNLMANKLLEGDTSVQSIMSYYHLGKAKPSPGTKLTMKLAKYNPLVLFENGEAVPIKDVEIVDIGWQKIGLFTAIPYPLPEICFFKWETKAKEIGSFLLVDKEEASFMKFKPPAKTKDEVINKFRSRNEKGPTVEQREEQKFIIVVEVKGVNFVRNIQLEGEDMYRLTAKIIRYFVQTILAGNHERNGVLSPNQFLKQDHDFFGSLKLKLENC